MSTYIDLTCTPGKNDVVCLFRVEQASSVSFEKAVDAVADESSIGTWVQVKSAERALKGLTPHIFSLDKKSNLVKIAYPIELFECSNVPGILSSIAGNIFGMKVVQNLRLMDVRLSGKIVKSFRGPRFGISGVRKILKVRDRPLIGTIVKPKLGLPFKEHARVAYEAWIGGCSIVKDDENLTSQNFNPFKKRVKETLRLKEKAEKETGEVKAYLPNVTAEASEMIRRAKYVADQDGNYMMVDVVTCGMSGLQTLRNYGPNLPIHAHRAMHAMFTRNKKHGMTMLALAKFLRLIGVDTCHIGTAIAKMTGDREEVISIRDEITLAEVEEKNDRLGQSWFGLKPVLPVSSGGIHPGMVPELVRIFGNDVVIQMGGGIHGHPGGTRAGSMAARQALDAVFEGVALKEYSKSHKELKSAIDLWGVYE